MQGATLLIVWHHQQSLRSQGIMTNHFPCNAACSAYGSQMSQTIALKMVQASLATAMSYLSVVWGIMSGYLVFTEVKQIL